ncbi:MAG: CBS domain-containing protein [Fuerstiella sp.]|jgi:predicted transcriptional regulator|nr:CBS domain-containing protein [Fuerstiella sp.]MCP4512024.1 CBS domain-containing protein [Fuerstiella sp.]
MDTTTITAEEIMTRKLAVTSPDTDLSQATEELIKRRVSGLPVVDRTGNFVGRFSERTAIVALDLGTVEDDSAVTQQLQKICAADLMSRSSLVLSSSLDVFQSINLLLAQKVSGASVVDEDGTLRGVFSEKSAMRVFIGLCWEQLPSSDITAWIVRAEERQITEDTRLNEILDRFHNTHYRRLIVLRGNKLIGEVTRREALQAALNISRELSATGEPPTTESSTDSRTKVESWMYRENTGVRLRDDVLAIAQRFQRSPARQIPVVHEERLEGQISRSDLLRAVQRSFPEATETRSTQPLYLSSVNKRDAGALM